MISIVLIKIASADKIAAYINYSGSVSTLVVKCVKMKWFLVLALFVAVWAQDESGEDGLTLAEPCDAEACQLPDCRCSSTNIPGGLAARDVPQVIRHRQILS